MADSHFLCDVVSRRALLFGYVTMPEFPECNNEWLSEVVRALRSRSKTISYRTRGRPGGWTVTREIAADDLERVNVDLDYMSNDQTRLSIWADDLMWFRVCRGTANDGWNFMLSFSGTTAPISATQLVEQLISSLGADESELLAIWQNVQPQVERLESKP